MRIKGDTYIWMIVGIDTNHWVIWIYYVNWDWYSEENLELLDNK